jgi:hypothetical protein
VGILGRLTFKVTCERQRDALARQGIMSIARHAGQVWHAVARQVHRRVRQHLERSLVQAGCEAGKTVGLVAATN